MINIKLERLKRGLTQQQLAERTDLTYQDISRYETGRVNPTLDRLCRLADALNVTTDRLLGRDDK